MPITSKQGAAFVAALTAEDVLTSADHMEAKKAGAHALWEAGRLGEVAYHRAMAAGITACMSRVNGAPDSTPLNTEHGRASRALIVAADRYFRLPSSTQDHVREKASRLNRWRCAIGGCDLDVVQFWNITRDRWRAQIEQEAAARGVKLKREA